MNLKSSGGIEFGNPIWELPEDHLWTWKNSWEYIYYCNEKVSQEEGEQAKEEEECHHKLNIQ